MLDKRSAKELIKFVNDAHAMQDLSKYIDIRIDTLRDKLEHSKDIRDVNHLQGALIELRRFKTIREEILQKAQEDG